MTHVEEGTGPRRYQPRGSLFEYYTRRPPYVRAVQLGRENAQRLATLLGAEAVSITNNIETADAKRSPVGRHLLKVVFKFEKEVDLEVIEGQWIISNGRERPTVLTDEEFIEEYERPRAEEARE